MKQINIAKFFLIIIITLIIQAIIVFGAWQNTIEYSIIDFNISSGMNIQMQKNSQLNEARIDLEFFPRENYKQQIIKENSMPKYEKINDKIVYKWTINQHTNFLLDYQLKINNELKKIDKRVNYPILSLPPEVLEYLEPTEMIDVNPEILKISEEIAQDTNDLYEIVYETAEWVRKNIEYDLATLSEDVTKTSSWVLQNKKGVCGEITSLFISLLRSKGIPARFISGYAYTELEIFPEPWGAHAWAEVYFPGYGWVDWDITYGQYGYVDATHIKLSESKDSSNSAINYYWKGIDLQATTKPLIFQTNFIETKTSNKKNIDLEMNMRYPQIKIGSYNLVEAKITNKNNYYITENVHLAPTQNIIHLTESSKQVMLKPSEEKTIYWIVKTENLADNYIYTFPMRIVTSKETEAKTQFMTGRDYIETNLQLLEKIVEDSKKSTSLPIKVLCTTTKNFYYEYENLEIQCNFETTKAVTTEICFQQECEEVFLDKISRNYNPEIKKGINNFFIEIKTKEGSKTEILEFIVMDEPKISININKINENIEFNDLGKIIFEINKESESTIHNIQVNIKGSLIDRNLSIKEIKNKQVFEIEFSGRELNSGKNNIIIQAKYEDFNGKKYQETKEIIINLENLTLLDKIIIFLRDLGITIEKLFV